MAKTIDPDFIQFSAKKGRILNFKSKRRKLFGRKNLLMPFMAKKISGSGSECKKSRRSQQQ
jgi:hypothetical protein